MPPAATIDDAIAFAEFDIAAQCYAAVESTDTNMGLWIAGMFSEATGIYKPSANPPTSAPEGIRQVTNWWGPSIVARRQIESVAVGGCGPVGVAAVVDVVVRTLWAVKQATRVNASTAAQETAVVALYNAVWQ